MKKITILGSTGSIGRQSLEVITQFKENFQVYGLSCGKNTELFKEQLLLFRPALACVQHEENRVEIQKFLQKNNLKTQLLYGKEGLETLASDTKTTLLVIAIVGTAALYPAYLAIQNQIPIALACKEILVSAGALMMDAAKKKQVQIIPIDSEHAAIKQCLASVNEDISKVQKVMITASGGAFRNHSKAQLSTVNKEDALKHPNWTMGPKITVDSATLMNKALEVIEAHHLFQIPFEKIEVVIHPESTIHSAIELIDGNIIAQLGSPDMRFPIQYALSYPEKLKNYWGRASLTDFAHLTFLKPDHDRFPLLAYTIACGKKGGTWPAVVNAANEAYVNLFLDNKINFLEIMDRTIAITEAFVHYQNPSIDEIIQIDTSIKEKINRG